MGRAKLIATWCVGILALCGVVFIVLSFTAQAVAEMKVKELLASMQDVVRAEYGEVEVSLLRRSATIHDLRLEIIGGSAFNVDKLELSRFEQLEGMPRSLALSATGVRLPLSQDYFAVRGKSLREMGYDVLALDYDLDFDYDARTRWFKLENMTLRVRDAGELGMRLKLSNVDLAALLKGGAGVAFMVLEMGELRYTDHSLTGRIIDSIAREEGVQPGEVLATLDQGLRARQEMAAAAQDEFSVSALAALRSFLRQPGTIAVHAAPLQAVAMLQLAALEDPVEVLKALNMQISIDDNFNQ